MIHDLFFNCTKYSQANYTWQQSNRLQNHTHFVSLFFAAKNSVVFTFISFQDEKSISSVSTIKTIKTSKLPRQTYRVMARILETVLVFFAVAVMYNKVEYKVG